MLVDAVEVLLHYAIKLFSLDAHNDNQIVEPLTLSWIDYLESYHLSTIFLVLNTFIGEAGFFG